MVGNAPGRPHTQALAISIYQLNTCVRDGGGGVCGGGNSVQLSY